MMIGLNQPEQHTILIVDDVPANLAVVSQTLDRKGFNIKVAVTGEAGLKIAQNTPPELILLDVLLPDVDGFEVCRRLKQDARTQEIPIIFMTAMSDTEHKVMGFAAGGVDYLTKPVQAEEVLARVNTHLHLRSLASDLEKANQNLEQRVAERTAELARINESLRKQIMEREKTERALASRELEYRSLAENSPDNIIRYDKDCRAIYMNRTMLETFGIDATLLLNKKPSEIDFQLPKNAAKYEDNLRKVLRGEEAEDMEVMVPNPPYKNQVHLVRFASERDALGSITGALAIGRDISELKNKEHAIHRLNRELRALSDCNQVLVRAENEQELLDEICHIICDNAGYALAWVGFLQDDSEKPLRQAAWAGKSKHHAELERYSAPVGDNELGRGSSDSAIRNGELSVINQFASDPMAAPWRELARRFGFRSAIALPLKDEQAHCFGVLNIYSTAENAFTPEEQRLLAELADDLAFGIVNLRRRIEHARAEEQIRIAATALEAQEGILITDAQRKILRVNSAFCEITGFSADEAIGATPNILKSDRHDAAYFKQMWDRIHAEGSWQDEIWNRRRNGEDFPGWLNITAVRNPQGEVTHYVGTLTDITERKLAEAEIEHLAYHDPLTRLPNRRLLLDRLDQALAAAERGEDIGALLYVDLDNFKLLNDSRGHDVGDQLLILIAQDLQECIKEEDTVARIGGDEFMILLGNIGSDIKTATEKSAEIGQQVTTALDHPYEIEGQAHHITASIGITFFSGDRASVRELMKQADIAMYKAKFDGRNSLRYFDPEMQAELANRAELEIAMREGIDKQQFYLEYQAQVDNARGIVAAELLLRWNHPERGTVSPGDFIPVAEETGLILPIGTWVLESACEQLNIWATDPVRRELNLAVNVSQQQFEHEGFVDQVREIVKRTNAPAQRLKLELTETLLIRDIEGSIKKMLSLKAIGVDFSLDDFGTGYSSLAYLTRLPLRQLKIDRSFIAQLPDNRNDAVIAQTIISMARNLGISVIAEGVETEAQRQFLEQHGCNTFQGFLFSKPVALAEFEQLSFPPVEVAE